jgi:hypothetical protein
MTARTKGDPALSTDTGLVEIVWGLEGDRASEHRFTMVSGPTVVPAMRQGFDCDVLCLMTKLSPRRRELLLGYRNWRQFDQERQAERLESSRNRFAVGPMMGWPARWLMYDFDPRARC